MSVPEENWLRQLLGWRDLRARKVNHCALRRVTAAKCSCASMCERFAGIGGANVQEGQRCLGVVARLGGQLGFVDAPAGQHLTRHRA